MREQWKELVELDYEHLVYSTAVHLHRGYFCDQYLYEKEVKMCCASIQRQLWQGVIRMNLNGLDADDLAVNLMNSVNFSSLSSPYAGCCRSQYTALMAT